MQAWLGLDYVDHLMTHFPADWYVTPERSSPARRQEEWRALEDIWSSGEVRARAHAAPAAGGEGGGMAVFVFVCRVTSRSSGEVQLY